MGNVKYRVVLTATAIYDADRKADYINRTLREPGLANIWYRRLRAEIQEQLTRFPYKYPLCHVEKWADKGVRQFSFRNDVILYSVDEDRHTVYIRRIFTKGRELSGQ